MVTSIFRSDSVSSRMRKRFSLPSYSNKSIYPDEQTREYESTNNGSASIPQPPVTKRPQLKSNDEAQLREAVTSLYQQVDPVVGETRDQQQTRETPQTELSEEASTAASPSVKRSKSRSRRSVALETLSSLSSRLSVLVEPMEEQEETTDSRFATRNEDPFLQFNGLLYSFEFGPSVMSSSRVFEAALPRIEVGGTPRSTSHTRYRPQNPASKAKKSRYSWGGFDLAHRNQNMEEQDDLIAILEHDESNTNDAFESAAPVDPPAPAAAAAPAPRKKSPQRQSYYQDKRRSGVIENYVADSIAANSSIRNENTLGKNDNDSDNIQAFIPLGEASGQFETPPPEKKRSFIRRLSLTLFGRRKTDPLIRNAHMHSVNNAIRV